MTLEETICQIHPADRATEERAWQRWDCIAKPLRGLGLLEEAIARIAGMTRTVEVDLSRRALVVFCADNGVVEEGVTQTGQEVTAVVTENLSKGDTSVCKMARVAHAEVFPVDIGVAREVSGERIIRRKIAYGTKNMTKGPAMTKEEAVRALEVGIELAQNLKQQGYRILATGEMGIGNTTTSSAVASVLLGLPPEKVAGRGAGLSSAGLERKREAIRRAIARNSPDPMDALDVLQKVGGLDLAGGSRSANARADRWLYFSLCGFTRCSHLSSSKGVHGGQSRVRGTGCPLDSSGVGAETLFDGGHDLRGGNRRSGGVTTSGYGLCGLRQHADI